MDQGFNKSHRLLKQFEFVHTLEQGTKIVSPNLILYGNKTTSESNARLGLIVSKKVGKAATRNRVKRSLRESFRIKKASYSGLDIVVIARHSASTASNADLANTFGHCLNRLKVQIQAKP